MLAPTSKSPEEREFVVESGAYQCTCWAKKKRFKLRWTGHFAKIQEPYCGGKRPVENCKQTRKHKYRFTILISSWQCNYSKKRLLFYPLENSAKTMDIPASGSAVKNHGWTKRRRQCFAKRTISYLLLFPGCPPLLVAIRLQHRHCRICPRQVWSKSEVTNWFQETGADHTQKTLNQNRKRNDNRESDGRLRDLP